MDCDPATFNCEESSVHAEKSPGEISAGAKVLPGWQNYELDEYRILFTSRETH